MDNPTPRPALPALEPTTLPEVDESNGTDTELSVSSSSATQPSRVTLGDYELGEKIGAGAMSSVYRARQIRKNRPAAVKVLRRHLANDPLFLQRFLREADAMARLRHPNIVRCYGVGKQQ